MRAFIVLLLFCLGGQTFGQRTQDVVYLKDGSIIRGDVIQHIPGKHLKLETADHSIWVFESNRIDSIKVERSLGKSRDVKGKGFYNATSIGVLAGRTNWGTAYSFSLTTVNGWKINDQLGFGFGTGIEVINDAPYFPLYAEARYDFKLDGFTPFIRGYSGYALPANNRDFGWGSAVHKGGYIGGGEIGVRNQIGDHSAIIFGVGYRYMHLKTTWDDPWGWPEGTIREEITDYNRFTVKFGFLFN